MHEDIESMVNEVEIETCLWDGMEEGKKEVDGEHGG